MERRGDEIRRINIQLPRTLKVEAEAIAARRGESLSAFLRESAKERIARIRQEERESLLVEAYQALAEDNARLAQEHEPVDLEGWE